MIFATSDLFKPILTFINHSISYPIHPVLQWQLKGYPYNDLEFIVYRRTERKTHKKHDEIHYIWFGIVYRFKNIPEFSCLNICITW